MTSYTMHRNGGLLVFFGKVLFTITVRGALIDAWTCGWLQSAFIFKLTCYSLSVKTISAKP
jgi:hypothetical protein